MKWLNETLHGEGNTKESEDAFELLKALRISEDRWRQSDLNTQIDWLNAVREKELEAFKAKILRRYEDEISKGLPNRIKLSFVGHSMGCFVVTNTIRILSDVFDVQAIAGTPTSEIGHVFSLSRLVLVAPDIPVEMVLPRRANFLRAALRRCEEAYVFCNEADLALRLASPVANYFSFPLQQHKSGYRLGNLTVQWTQQKYGIVNYDSTSVSDPVSDPFDVLEIRALRQRYTLEEIRSEKEIFREQSNGREEIVTNRFTYFDCTDYRDRKSLDNNPTLPDEKWGDPKGIVSFACNKKALYILDYLRLCFAQFGGIPRRIDTHGGYFEGVFTQSLIYDLAFAGFQGMLLTFLDISALSFDQFSPAAQQEHLKASLNRFSETCQKKCIKVAIAPIRYRDICPDVADYG